MAKKKKKDSEKIDEIEKEVFKPVDIDEIDKESEVADAEIPGDEPKEQEDNVVYIQEPPEPDNFEPKAKTRKSKAIMKPKPIKKKTARKLTDEPEESGVPDGINPAHWQAAMRHAKRNF